MRRILLSLAIGAIATAAGTAWSENIKDGTEASGETKPSPAATRDQPDSAAPNPGTGDSWRYKRHQDLWWYWLPNEKWVYWSGDHWVDYDPQINAQLPPSSRRRSYSASGGSSSGKWGPKRYNSYGQVEYPYSRRTRGIKQLGPMPAIGGVRSLPGWGGER